MSAARCSAAGHERCNRGGMCERDRGEQKCRTSFCTTDTAPILPCGFALHVKKKKTKPALLDPKSLSPPPLLQSAPHPQWALLLSILPNFFNSSYVLCMFCVCGCLYLFLNEKARDECDSIIITENTKLWLWKAITK